ncbi:hypothetical protein OESDEN_08028 [Oesophagostomum dentatum]|uniref:Uncharacterized protein n=1 Tax=Oesophagostomum dentatum TaxID=61180 RepID=A0A0B1T8H4_OESDE|nr:hypothetical protein OESDEN_08028 [Oesophagostomum dentatum]
MMYKVVTELEACFSHHLPERLRVRLIETICAYVFNNNLSSRIRIAVYVTVILFTLLHLILTCLSLYGTYSCRPVFIRPFLFDAVFSFVLLLLFVCFSVLIYWRLTSSEDLGDKEDVMKVHLRNIYVGAAFLLSYLVWMVVSIVAYMDTKKLHADFMYWIVEERVSMRSKANVSSDLSTIYECIKDPIDPPKVHAPHEPATQAELATPRRGAPDRRYRESTP